MWLPGPRVRRRVQDDALAISGRSRVVDGIGVEVVSRTEHRNGARCNRGMRPADAAGAPRNAENHQTDRDECSIPVALNDAIVSPARTRDRLGKDEDSGG